MIVRRGFALMMTLALAVVLTLPTVAQEAGGIFADGLSSPRNMSFDSDGNLYVAEAGIAGPQMTAAEDPYGASASVSVVAPDGTSDVVVAGLISYREGNPLGAHDVIVTDESYWVLLGETADFRIPFTHALVELDKNTGRVKTFVDLLSLELDTDPDNNPNEQSNAVDMAIAPDGSITIANAGCNCLMSWSAEAGLSILTAWDFATDNPVPTSVAYGPDGDLYVGFLTGFPFPQGGSRIERWSDGQLVETIPGLTAVTSLLVTDDSTIYAVELGVFDQGWNPGRVIMIQDGAVVPVLEGLTQPYGIVQGTDGTLYVSTNTFGAADGQIITIPMMNE